MAQYGESLFVTIVSCFSDGWECSDILAVFLISAYNGRPILFDGRGLVGYIGATDSAVRGR